MARSVVMEFHDTISCAIGRLPPELLRHIFLELVDWDDRPTLRSCTMVSHTWRDVAFPVLMRHVVILHDYRRDRSALFHSWLSTHQDMWKHIKILDFSGDIKVDDLHRNYEAPSQDTIDIDLDALKDALPGFPALEELRLMQLAILEWPASIRNTPPLPIRSLTLQTKGHFFDDDADDDDLPVGYTPFFGLTMFSTLSAVLSVVAPDVLILRGGYQKVDWDPPDSFPAPTMMQIHRLCLGKHWLDPSYWRGLLAPNALEHLAVSWPWMNRGRAIKLQTLTEDFGNTLSGLDMHMDNGFPRMLMGITPTEDWGQIAIVAGACTRLRNLTLRMPVYARLHFHADLPPRPVYHTVLSSASRSLLTLTIFLTVHHIHRRRRRGVRGSVRERAMDNADRLQLECMFDIVGIEVLDAPWVRERFTRLERVEIVLASSRDVHDTYDSDVVLEDTLLCALPNLREAGLLHIVKVSSR